MQQIADWLEKLGLGQYAQRFAESAIDLDVLPDLTDQDLEKLGVLLGHRRHRRHRLRRRLSRRRRSLPPPHRRSGPQWKPPQSADI
jgi:hypothetical protein